MPFLSDSVNLKDAPVVGRRSPSDPGTAAGPPSGRCTAAPSDVGLRHDFTVCDAAYVALAEMLNATLVVCDGKFARASGAGCRIETIG